MKPLGAKWLEELHNYLLQNKSLAMNGLKAAGKVKFIIHFNYNHDSL